MAAEVALENVIDALSVHGIRHMPLKGALMSAIGCADPQTRPMVDIDVLVRSHDFTHACDALVESGWAHAGEATTGAVFIHPDFALPLDLHHALFGPGLFDLETRDVFDRATSLRAYGAATRRMDDYDLFAHLVGHFVNSRFGPKSTRATDLSTVAYTLSLRAGTCAVHLDAHGLGRAARFALPACDGPFCKQVLSLLRRDRLGDAIGALGRRAIAVAPPADRRLAWLPHVLNRTLRAGSTSALHHARRALL